MMLGDADHRLANGSGHAGSRALGARTGTAITSIETDGARQLAGEEFTLRLRLCGAFAVAEQVRLVDVVLDLGESPAIGGFRLLIQQHAGVHVMADGEAVLSLGKRSRLAFPLRGDEVECVKLASRFAEQAREIAEASRVVHTHREPVELHQPVVALATEDARAAIARLDWRSRSGASVAARRSRAASVASVATFVRRFSRQVHRTDSLERRPRRPELV